MKPASNWLAALPKKRLLAEFSLWSADLIRLADDMARVEPHVDIYHVDVADGHFSPAFLFFPDLVAACRKLTAKPIHVHLMCADAILVSQVDQFAESGADLISVHVENANAIEALHRVKGHGLPAGVVLQVQTPVAAAADLFGRGVVPHAARHAHWRERAGARSHGLPEACRSQRLDRRSGRSRSPPTAASARTPCPTSGARALKPSSWARSPSTRRIWRRASPGCARSTRPLERKPRPGGGPWRHAASRRAGPGRQGLAAAGGAD